MATFIIDEYYDVTISPPKRIKAGVPEIHKAPRRWEATGQVHGRDNHEPVDNAITETGSTLYAAIAAVKSTAATLVEGLPHPPDKWTPRAGE